MINETNIYLENLNKQAKVLLEKIIEMDDNFDSLAINFDNMTAIFEKVKISFELYKEVLESMNEIE